MGSRSPNCSVSSGAQSVRVALGRRRAAEIFPEVLSTADGATRTSDTHTLLIGPEPASIVRIATHPPCNTSAYQLAGCMLPVSA
jgi:hypothetical protein